MSVLRRVRIVLGQQSSPATLGWWPVGMLTLAMICGALWLSRPASMLAEEATQSSDVADSKSESEGSPAPPPAVVESASGANFASSGAEWELPEYIVEPPDVLKIRVFGLVGRDQVDESSQASNEALPGRSRFVPNGIDGEFLVSAEGNVNLGPHGNVAVAGLTLGQATAAVESHLAQDWQNPNVYLDVWAYHSKAYYIIESNRGQGDHVVRLPITGNETVLDAIASIGGIERFGKRKLYLRRPSGLDAEKTLPVDWPAISRGESTATNYRLLPGDRLFIASVDDEKNKGKIHWQETEIRQTIPIVGKFTTRGKAQKTDPPTDDELLNVLRMVAPDSLLLAQGRRDQIDVEMRFVGEIVDPLRFYPNVGFARQHHAFYECAVTQHDGAADDATGEDPRERITIHIDHQHLHVGDGVASSSPPLNQKEPEKRRQAGAELVVEVYSVADLVIPLQNPQFSETGEQRPLEKDEADFDSLVELIQSTIAPDTWEDAEGRRKLAVFETNLSLVVSQTPAIHEQIAGLLEQLRKLRELVIILRATTIELPSQLAEELGLQSKRLAKLTSEERERILAFAQGHRRVNVHQSPKAALFNGQTMQIELGDNFVLSLQGVFSQDENLRLTAALANGELGPTALPEVWMGDEALLVRTSSAADDGDKMAFRLFTAEVAEGAPVRR